MRDMRDDTPDRDKLMQVFNGPIPIGGLDGSVITPKVAWSRHERFNFPSWQHELTQNPLACLMLHPDTAEHFGSGCGREVHR